MKNHRYLIALLAMAIFCPQNVVTAKTADKHAAAKQRYSDGTVVTKNPDGSVEVSDGGGSGAPTSDAPRRTNYRPAPAAHIRYGDGVIVHRHADGTVDVTDEETLHPKIHWDGPVPAQAHIAKRAATKTKSAKPKKSK